MDQRLDGRVDGAPRAQLDFRSGGWVLALSLVLVLGVIAWRVFGWSDSLAWREGEVPAPGRSNGFDLATSVKPVHLFALERPRDGIPPLDDPEALAPAALAKLNESRWTKALVDEDPVIGVAVNGEVRAYPVRVLTYHHIANDILGGVPIAVTWCPFTGTATVYDRRLPGQDEPLSFGVSGLVYNNNVLLYDRRSQLEASTLWSQLTGTPVAGARVNQPVTLTRVPCQLLPWKEWWVQQPRTTFIRGEERMAKRYRQDPYLGYPLSDKLFYPLAPEPPPSAHPGKELLLRIAVAGEERLLSATEFASHAREDGTMELTLGGRTITVHGHEGRTLVPLIWATPLAALDASSTCYRFAWEAHLGPRAP